MLPPRFTSSLRILSLCLHSQTPSIPHAFHLSLVLLRVLITRSPPTRSWRPDFGPGAEVCVVLVDCMADSRTVDTAADDRMTKVGGAEAVGHKFY